MNSLSPEKITSIFSSTSSSSFPSSHISISSLFLNWYKLGPSYKHQDCKPSKTSILLNTTLGKLLPFEIAAYFHPSTGMITNDYGDDAIAIYTTSVKFNDPENDPFYLVYASPSFYSDIPGQKNMILVYKINPDYQP